MKTFELASGAYIPAMGLGTWQAPETLAYTAVKQALHCGYHHIDCAAIYLNEPAIGQALGEYIKQDSSRREQLWITSKLWNSYHAPEAVAPAVKRTLKALQLDYLDLYLIHWPVAFKTEIGLHSPQSGDGFISLDALPLTETWHAMEALVTEGLVKYIGVSNVSSSKLQTILDAATIPPIVNQVECHPHFPQHELIQFCHKKKVHFSGYSPLGSGMLPETLAEQNEPMLLDNHIIIDLARHYHATPAQILLAYQLARGISVLPRSVHPGHIQENFDAQTIELDDAAIERINRIDKNCRYLTGQFCWGVAGSPYDRDTFWC